MPGALQSLAEEVSLPDGVVSELLGTADAHARSSGDDDAGGAVPATSRTSAAGGGGGGQNAFFAEESLVPLPAGGSFRAASGATSGLQPEFLELSDQQYSKEIESEFARGAGPPPPPDPAAQTVLVSGRGLGGAGGPLSCACCACRCVSDT